MDPTVRIADPDASRSAKLRYATGEGLLAAGVLAGLGTVVVGGLTVVGVLGGLFLPLVGATIASFAIAALAQAGVAQPRITHPEMIVPLAEGEALPAPVEALARRQHELADALCVAWSQLPEDADEALATVLHAARRVAYLAARDLHEAVTVLAPLVAQHSGQQAPDPDAKIDRTAAVQVDQRHGRVRAAVTELERLTDLLGESSADRRSAALEELSALTNWVAHRSQALEELGTAAVAEPDDADGGGTAEEGSR